MKKEEIVSRDPKVMNGALVFAGTRVPVEILIQHLTAGNTIDVFLDDFPAVTREQAVAYLEMTLAAPLPPQSPGIPKILYKYRYFDEPGYHLKTIEEAQLWFTSAYAFNDPFDSRIHYRYDDCPPGIRKRWVQDFVHRENPDANHKERRKLATDILRGMRKDHKPIKTVKKRHVERINKRFGLCCLSAVRDDLLMWAHYSNNHQGFCVGFDVKKLLEIQESIFKSDERLLALERIKYDEHMPTINFFSSRLSGEDDKDLLILLCTKSDHWAYEKEYRLFYFYHPDEALSVGHDAIAEVILGCHIEDANRMKVIRLLDGLDCQAKVYQAKMKDDKFGLKFEIIR